MPKRSAGLLLYRLSKGHPEVLLVHPGGPFWTGKAWASWSIPKGEYAPDEDPLEAARREFQEETGFACDGRFIALAPVRQPGGKTVSAWAVQGDCDPSRLVSNLFDMEWPPGSGVVRSFPEVDQAAWFDLSEARKRILKGQVPLLDELETNLTPPV